MKKGLQWVGIGLGGVIGLVILVVVAIYINTGLRLSRQYSIKPEPVAVPADALASDRGRHWAGVYCQGCHGDNLGGTVFFDDPSLGRIPATNLTRGAGGIGGTYDDGDWILAIRHGLSGEGKPLLIMPSADFYYLGDADLGDLVAYLKTVPPVENELGKRSTAPMAQLLVGFGAFGDVIPAEGIRHDVRPPVPQPGVTVEYGQYLNRTGGCASCHGADLSGSQPPDPGSPEAPNLTQGGPLRYWSEKDFVQAMRTRESRWMPYRDIGRMTDDELMALLLYLKSVPEKASTTP